MNSLDSQGQHVGNSKSRKVGVSSSRMNSAEKNILASCESQRQNAIESGNRETQHGAGNIAKPWKH